MYGTFEGSAAMGGFGIGMPVGGVLSLFGIVANLLDPQRLELETAQ